MKRQKLIAEVKNEYGRLASAQSWHQTAQSTAEISSEMYYEKLLSHVIHEIESGTFDTFQSGQQIMEAVANDKDKWLSSWSEEAETQI